MKFRVHVGAALGGFVWYLALNLIVGAVLTVRIVTADAPTSFTDFTAVMGSTSAWRLFGVLANVLASVIGGYVAARVAKERAIVAGIMSVWFFALLSVYSRLMRPTPETWLVASLTVLAVTLSAACGGAIGARRIARDAARATTVVGRVP